MSRSAYVRVARHAGLREAAGLRRALAELDGAPDTVAATLRAHQLVTLVTAALAPEPLESALPPSTARAVRERIPPAVPFAALVAGFREAREALLSAGIPVLLLKGFVLADRLYGGLAARPQHDVDLLVRRRQFAAARRVLRGLGFEETGRDLHSRTFARGLLQVDLHWCLRWAPAFALDEARLWRDAEPAGLQGLECETVSEPDTLVLLALGTFEDLGQGMAKLKQLLDLYLYLRRVDGAFDWPAFFTARAAERLRGIVETVLALTVALFDAPLELPRLTAALPPGRAVDRETALALVFAARKAPENLAWFASVYPGSLAHYLAWFWYGGFPGNLRAGAWARLAGSVRVVSGRPR